MHDSAGFAKITEPYDSPEMAPHLHVTKQATLNEK
jgi:hypothetical protein